MALNLLGFKWAYSRPWNELDIVFGNITNDGTNSSQDNLEKATNIPEVKLISNGQQMFFNSSCVKFRYFEKATNFW